MSASNMRILLVDDEPLALNHLKRLVKMQPDVTVVASCRNGREAVELLQIEMIDLVFLDIQMPGMDGFEVIQQTQADIMPLVVFATAYDEFALRAFDHNAVDYLLKPFDAERVQTAIERARERLVAKGTADSKDAPISAIAEYRQEAFPEPPSRLPIKDGGHTHLVDFANIEWIDAAGDYMCVHSGGETHILRSTMKELAQKLSGQLVRIHRSTMVNLEKVISIDAIPKGECLLHLDGGVTLKVSRNYREAVQDLLG